MRRELWRCYRACRNVARYSVNAGSIWRRGGMGGPTELCQPAAFAHAGRGGFMRRCRRIRAGRRDVLQNAHPNLGLAEQPGRRLRHLSSCPGAPHRPLHPGQSERHRPERSGGRRHGAGQPDLQYGAEGRILFRHGARHRDPGRGLQIASGAISRPRLCLDRQHEQRSRRLHRLGRQRGQRQSTTFTSARSSPARRAPAPSPIRSRWFIASCSA